MFILFDSAAIVKPNTFAAELNPPAVHAALVPGTRKSPFSAIDQAWVCGFTAALEADFQDVFPPQHFTPAEVEAFHLGAMEGYRKAEFEDISCPADWDTDMEGIALEVELMAAEREAMWALERGYFHA